MRAAVALFATLVLSLILTVEYPDVMIKPGRLSEGHQGLNRECMKCHVLFQGARARKCASCHKPEQIGRLKVDGTPVSHGGSPKALFHQHLANTDCAGCHIVHFSERARQEPATFRHDFLTPEARNNCASCHSDKRPADALHQRAGESCVACHTTGSWRPATFDHQQVASNDVNCVVCHQKDRPADDLHWQSIDDCRNCHGTRAWLPSTFDHTRYFRFDRNHPSNCANCHTTGRQFTTYSCYGCHEHTPAGIATKHREEGISDFENCVRCHRSGDEDEAERGGGGRERDNRRREDGDDH